MTVGLCTSLKQALNRLWANTIHLHFSSAGMHTKGLAMRLGPFLLSSNTQIYTKLLTGSEWPTFTTQIGNHSVSFGHRVDCLISF